MKKKFNRNKIFIAKLFIVVIFVVSFFTIISNNHHIYTNLTYDINKTKSIKTTELAPISNGQVIQENNKPIIATTFNEVLTNAEKNIVTFEGTITGYGPDCEGCNGTVACYPYQNVKNGNIYFNDKTFGKIRIIAADSRIPCGTIVKVSNLNNYMDFYAIALDHGSAIKENLIDLLFSSENEAILLGKTNATYTIVRWGW